MTDSSLFEELRLLRVMGADGRAAAVRALRSARLGRRPENPDPHPNPHGAAASTLDDPMKYLTQELDAAIVQRGGKSIFDAKPRGELSAEAEERLAAWAEETPRRHPRATGRKPKDEPEGFVGRRQKPGRIVGTLSGKLGGFASDRDEGER